MTRLKRDERTSSIPLVVGSTLDDRAKGLALGADAYGIKPIDKSWLISTLERLVPERSPTRVLTVDDEEAHRFIIRELLNDAAHQVAEANSGHDGLRLIDELPPDVVLLDLRLTDMTGWEFRERLRQRPQTATLPVIIVTSQRLTAEETRRLGADCRILPKSELTRDSLRAAINDVVSAGRSAGMPS